MWSRIVIAVVSALCLGCSSAPENSSGEGDDGRAPEAAESSEAPIRRGSPDRFVTGDPLIEALLASDPVIIDFAVRFPPEVLDERMACVSAAVVEGIGEQRLDELGLGPPIDSLRLSVLAERELSSIAEVAVACPGNASIVRALLGTFLHQDVARCVEVELSGSAAALFEELAKEIPLTESEATLAAVATCDAELRERIDASRDGTSVDPARLDVAELIWTVYGVAPPIDETERYCRAVSIADRLDPTWYDAVQAVADGSPTADDVVSALFSADDDTVEEIFFTMLNTIAGGCGGSSATYVDFNWELQLSREQLVCVSSAPAESRLRPLLMQSDATQVEVAAVVEGQLATCGP